MSRRYPHRDPPFPPSHYLVIDLEATCDDTDWPRDEAEIIEIGAVLVDAATLAETTAFQSYVRPVRRPRLTPFCTALTTITQAQVDAAPLYLDALAALRHAITAAPRPVFCSWGSFDERLFQAESARREVPHPFEGHWNLKSAFSARARTRRRYGLKAALDRAGLTFEGTHHRGLDDARNVARLLPWCLGLRPIPKAKAETTDPTPTAAT
ncbi:MAG: 3'-5' exonuclease [bacterium]|nr:exonuclease domain-containing protein [Myxococcales bacterium]MCB9543475.1 exonuclease domain-containing protein [Myxococcales bacterium]MCB9551062.1 exonuclease domain-containing protein [Myxococcales bacterium]